MLNNINLDIGIIAIYYWGRSGSYFVGSLLDSHEEILTIPPGKFSYFYGRNEFWEKVKKRNYDIDEIIEYFYVYYYEIFNGKFAPNSLNYHKMGENKEEHIIINKSEFVKWLKAIGKEIDLKIRRNFFIAIHYAYELSLGRDVSKKKYINHQLHDPDFYRTKKILDDFNDVKFIGTFRYPIRAFYSLIRNFKESLNDKHFRAYKFEEYDLIYNGDFISLYNQFLMGWKIPYKELNLNLFPLYLDELHKSPKNVIKRLSIFLDIKENEVLLESTFALSCSALLSASSRTSLSVSITTSASPAPGTALSPTMAAGVDGPIDLTEVPSSSLMAFIRPYVLPTMTLSPTLSVPFWMITLATGPKPFSTDASTTTALASLVGSALSSITSA